MGPGVPWRVGPVARSHVSCAIPIGIDQGRGGGGEGGQQGTGQWPQPHCSYCCSSDRDGEHEYEHECMARRHPRPRGAPRECPSLRSLALTADEQFVLAGTEHGTLLVWGSPTQAIAINIMAQLDRTLGLSF